MRNNLFTALLKRIHEGILIAIPHEALLFIIKLILSSKLAEIISDRSTFCVTPRALAVKGCSRHCRFLTARCGPVLPAEVLKPRPRQATVL